MAEFKSNKLQTLIYTSNNDEGIIISDLETGKSVNVDPLGALKTITPIRLVGTAFSGNTKDTNFWTETVSGSGAVSQSGEVILYTGTVANSSAKYETVRKARKVTGTANQFRMVARNSTALQTNNLRRAGAYDDNNGFYAQFDGELFSVASRKSGSDNVINNGDFNGNLGSLINFQSGVAFTRVTIDYTSLSAKFFINGNLIHTISAQTESLTNTLDLPITVENINSGGNDTNNSYEILFATILRLGNIKTNTQYKYIGGNATTICKYGAGKLRRIINTDNSGRAIIYDGLSTSGSIISNIDTVKVTGDLSFDTPFNNGLTIVTSGDCKLTVIYE